MDTDVRRRLHKLDVLTGPVLESDLRWLEERKAGVAIGVAGLALAIGETLDKKGIDAAALEGIADEAMAEA